MSTKKTQKTTTNMTNTAAPPTWTLPGLEFAGGAVTDQLKNTVPLPAYGGDFIAALDPAVAMQQAQAYQDAANSVGDLGTFTQQQLQQMFQPRDMSAELNAAIEAAIAPTYRNLQENVLPGITNSALASGAYTNDRALGVVPTTAIRDANTSAQQIAATLGYQGLQAEEDRRLQRVGMLPDIASTVATLLSGKGDLIGAAGGVTQQQQQQEIDNAIAKHQYEVTAPYERIAPAAQLLALLSGNWGTQTQDGTQTTVQKTSGLGPVLQGAMGIASMAAGLGAFGPLGAAAGGLAAPAAGAFTKLPISDIFKRMAVS